MTAASVPSEVHVAYHGTAAANIPSTVQENLSLARLVGRNSTRILNTLNCNARSSVQRSRRHLQTILVN
jgi:hypothetical protein